MYPPIYRKKRHRSSTDLHSIATKQNVLKRHSSSRGLGKKRKPKSMSFRVAPNANKTPSRRALKLRNGKWSKIRKAAFSRKLFNHSMSDAKKLKKVEELYDRLKLKYDSLPDACESILIYDPREKLDLADATMFLTLNHPIESFTNHGKHVNFLLSARFGVFNQMFHHFYGYDEEPSTHHSLTQPTKNKLFRKNCAIAKLNFNWKFQNGNNVMHECAFGANRDILDMLLDHNCGIDISCANSFGYTPLQIAANKRNYYAVFRLIMEGSDVDYTYCSSCTAVFKDMSKPVKGESLAVSMAMKQFELRLHGQYHHGSEVSVRALCQQNPTLNEVVSAAEKQFSMKKLNESMRNKSRQSFLARTASMATFTSTVNEIARGSSMKTLIASRARSKYHRYNSTVDLRPNMQQGLGLHFEDGSPKNTGLVDFDSWRKSKKVSKKRRHGKRRRKSARIGGNAVMVIASDTVTSQWTVKGNSL